MDDGDRADLRRKKILVIYSEMEDWDAEDKLTSGISVDEMVSDLKKLGLDAEPKKINEPLENSLDGFDPRKTLIFNWVECWKKDASDYWTVPEFLERKGFVYTGSDPTALRLTIDKIATKKLLIENNISTPLSKIYLGNEENGWQTFPALVKPSYEHCSTGITREAVVDNGEQLHKRIEYLLRKYGHGVLVEDFIDGNEYNVAVWGNEKPEVLPIGMIDYGNFPDYHDRICSFDAKWREGSAQYQGTPVVCPAPLSESLQGKIEELALATYKLFKMRDYARIDIRVRQETPYVLDVNTNPDITTTGGFYRSMNRAGYSYGRGVAKILAMAMKRAKE